MAIVAVSESIDDRSVSGKYRDTMNYSRSFLVRVDSPSTSIRDISQAPGISFGAAHPDDGSVYAMEFDCKPRGDTLLLYVVTVKYSTPAREDKPEPFQLPADVWSGGSAVASAPCWQDKQGKPITNSAGISLPDLTMDTAEFSVSLTRCYGNLSFLGILQSATNKLNSDTFLGCPKHTWKCQGGRFSKKTENADGQMFVYWEVTFEFNYREDTWFLKPLDIGYSQLVDEEGNPTGSGQYTAAILGKDKKPIKEPASLSGGVAVDAGTPSFPKVINDGDGVNPYGTYPFSGFGSIG
jgi:hypothetical protein